MSHKKPKRLRSIQPPEINNQIHIMPRLEPRTKSQRDCLKEIIDHDILFINGLAGGGKTFVSVAYGILEVIKGNFDKLILIRPTVEALGEYNGFLPGTLEEKADPFLTPIWDILNKFLLPNELAKMRRDGIILIRTISHLRGTTFERSCVIVDECENCTNEQLQLIITRIGEGSKIILNGDDTQCDLKKQNGLNALTNHINLFKDYHDRIGVFQFDPNDIVRHPLIKVYLDRIAKRK